MVDLSSFKILKCNQSKLEKFGFNKEGKIFVLKKDILDDEFSFVITIKNGEIFRLDVIEKETGEPFSMFYIKEATGSFVGKINEECQKILDLVKQNCFSRDVFKSAQSKEVIQYISDKYGDEMEFLWEDYPKDAIWRRRDNKKWYGLIMEISRRKLGLDSDELVEVLDLKTDIDLPSLVDNKFIFPGYHMNKKHWITVVLDNSLSSEKIFRMIDESYCLAKKKK